MAWNTWPHIRPRLGSREETRVGTLKKHAFTVLGTPGRNRQNYVKGKPHNIRAITTKSQTSAFV